MIYKYKTGKGSRVSVSLFDAAIAALANQAANYLCAGHVPQRIGSLHPNIAPYGEIITCKDGTQIVLAIGTDKQFKALCSIIRAPELASDTRYIHNAVRVKNRNTLIGVLQQKIQSFECREFVEACRENQVPAGVIRDLQQVFDLPAAQQLILSDELGKRVKSAVFRVEELI